MKFNVPVESINGEPATLVLQEVEIVILNRTTAMVNGNTEDVVRVKTIAKSEINATDYGLIVRFHHIPVSVYDNAFLGFDTVTNKPIINPVVLAGLLQPFNLQLV